jgi:hypothetical protein
MCSDFCSYPIEDEDRCAHVPRLTDKNEFDGSLTDRNVVPEGRNETLLALVAHLQSFHDCADHQGDMICQAMLARLVSSLQKPNPRGLDREASR